MSKRIWFISDPHFHHANMIAGGRIGIRSQFATVEQMNRHIIETVNSVVDTHDKLYVLGDITLQRGQNTSALDIVREWNGHKRLILGNHDHFAVQAYVDAGFEKVMGYREMAGILFSHIPCHPSQFYRFKGNVHGHTHLSIVTRDREEKYTEWDWTEHTRTVTEPDPRYVNVCVEVVNYTPVELNTLIEYFDHMEGGNARPEQSPRNSVT